MTGHLSTDSSDAILRIYDTAADPSLWQNVLDDIVESVGAQGSVIFEWQNQNGSQHLTSPFFSNFYSAKALACIIHKATGEISSYVFIYSISRKFMFNSKKTDCLFDTRSYYRVTSHPIPFRRVAGHASQAIGRPV